LHTFAALCLQLFRLITVMDSDNYPECCHAIYIANAGATFSGIWKLLAPFVDKGTRDKVHVLGGVKASQVSRLAAALPLTWLAALSSPDTDTDHAVFCSSVVSTTHRQGLTGEPATGGVTQ
jgi:hypothetical protein